MSRRATRSEMASSDRSFRDFYPDSLAEHRNPVSRRLHFLGTLLVISTLVFAVAAGRWLWLLALPVFGPELARLGRFVFERNRPATFRHPLYSPAEDFLMIRDMLIGRVRWR